MKLATYRILLTKASLTQKLIGQKSLNIEKRDKRRNRLGKKVRTIEILLEFRGEWEFPASNIILTKTIIPYTKNWWSKYNIYVYKVNTRFIIICYNHSLIISRTSYCPLPAMITYGTLNQKNKNTNNTIPILLSNCHCGRLHYVNDKLGSFSYKYDGLVYLQFVGTRVCIFIIASIDSTRQLLIKKRPQTQSYTYS